MLPALLAPQLLPLLDAGTGAGPDLALFPVVDLFQVLAPEAVIGAGWVKAILDQTVDLEFDIMFFPGIRDAAFLEGQALPLDFLHPPPGLRQPLGKILVFTGGDRTDSSGPG